MPKLDGTHIEGRLRERLEKLRSGEEVAKREIEALLSDRQIDAMDAAWAEQQQLRKQKRARTKEEEIALGWKTKREIQIEAYERAIAQADMAMLETLEGLQRKAEVRQARIYLDSYFKATKEGKTASHIIWIFEEALKLKENQRAWWIAPTIGQAKIAYDRMKTQITDKEFFKPNETNRTITLITGFSIFL
jgi:hypothetical protein